MVPRGQRWLQKILPSQSVTATRTSDVSSAVAIVGLIALSKAGGILIFLAATIYGFGKTFFWPTMLGVVSERFPKGGALTLNTISAVGMLSVGVIGAAFLGNIQDKEIDQGLQTRNPALHARVVVEEKVSVFGSYRSLDQDKVGQLATQDKSIIENITAKAKQNALMTVAIFPAFMLVCYVALILYFRSKGGYQAEELAEQERSPAEESPSET